MIPVHQTKFTPPDGNCFQAAIASLLELPLEAVPNFVTFEEWWAEFETFMRQYGLIPMSYDVGDWTPSGYHLTSGLSPRGEWYHVIVGYNGEPVHDPNPNGNCELRTIEQHTIFWSTLESLPPPLPNGEQP